MSDYSDILKLMPLSTTNSVINMNPDGVAPVEGLTSAKLLGMLREMEENLRKLPPVPAFDLYAHPTIMEAYELNLTDTFPFLQRPGRRTLVVPKDRLEEISRTLAEAGADVRISPQYGPPSAETQPAEPT